MTISPAERAEIDRRATVLTAQLADKPVPDSVIQLLRRLTREQYYESLRESGAA
jgi:hypothetical protein